MQVANFDVKTSVEGLTVVHTQSVHLQAVHKFEIDINGYKCTIRFKSDGGEPRYEGKPLDKGFDLDCYNHNNIFNECIFKPIPIALLDGKLVSMTYVSSMVSQEENIRKFEYCLWMES